MIKREPMLLDKPGSEDDNWKGGLSLFYKSFLNFKRRSRLGQITEDNETFTVEIVQSNKQGIRGF